MKKIAFIGTGIMGSALAGAAAHGIDPKDIVITDKDTAKAEALAKELGCGLAKTNAEAVRAAEYVLFCVKPQFLVGACEGLGEVFAECRKKGEKKVVISIVAGVEIETYRELLKLEANEPVIRMLPNTACRIGKGFTIIMEDASYTEAELNEVQHILRESGGFDVLPKSQFTAGAVLTSTSPAFIAMFANSLADGGVCNGLLRHQARRYALEGIFSTVQLLMSTDRHLEAMKDDVCSPAGPAMIGVKSLEDSGFRSSVINAVTTSYKRFDEIGKVK